MRASSTTSRPPFALVAGSLVASLGGAALVLFAVAHRDGAVYPIRSRLEELTPGRALTLGLAGIVAAAAIRVADRLGIGVPALERAAAVMRRLPRPAVSPAVALPVVIAVSASLWIVLSAESTIPRVLGDELIYSGLGKSIALHGSYLLRGDRDISHSLLYPLVISPAYALAPNGVSAHVAVQALNGVLFSLTAVPAYFLARRVVPLRLAMVVAIFAVLNPWGGFTAWVMTESLFYLVFTTLALALVLTLERPTVLRQSTVFVLIVALATIRAQAAAIPAAAITAVLIVGLSRRAVRATAREQRLLLGLLGAQLAAGALVLLVSSVSAYSVLFDRSVSPAAFVRWGAWNAGALAISLGVAAAVTLPAALTWMLRRDALPGERATAASTVALTAALIASVALLSESGFGLGYLQERSVFYAAPLVFTCFASWLHHGRGRYGWATSLASLGVLGLAVWLPSPPLGGWTAQAALRHVTEPLGLSAAGVVVVVGALVVLVSRTAFGPLALTVVALATITAVDQTSWNSPISPAQSKALAWIDSALPPGADATIINVDTRVPSGDTCAAAAKADQQFFVVLSEFLNTHVNQTAYLYRPVGVDYLAARKLELGPQLQILDRGKPLVARYVAIDSRVPMKGRPIARLDLASIGSDYSHGASLTLWEAAQPVSLDLRGPLRLTPRPDGRPCA